MAYGASFGVVGFDVEIEPGDRSKDSDVTELHIPGSDLTYVDVGGALANHLTLQLFFDEEANYRLLEDLVGTLATLVYFDGTLDNTYLKSLKRVRRYQGGGQTQATAEFIAASGAV